MSKGVADHRCLGYETYTDCGTEYDCGYETDIACDDCVFTVGEESGDYRRGIRPWSKKAQAECEQ